jgi:hypothetical protein
VPGCVRPRLAEIRAGEGRTAVAMAVLAEVAHRRDPDVVHQDRRARCGRLEQFHDLAFVRTAEEPGGGITTALPRFA